MEFFFNCLALVSRDRTINITREGTNISFANSRSTTLHQIACFDFSWHGWRMADLVMCVSYRQLTRIGCFSWKLHSIDFFPLTENFLCDVSIFFSPTYMFLVFCIFIYFFQFSCKSQTKLRLNVHRVQNYCVIL